MWEVENPSIKPVIHKVEYLGRGLEPTAARGLIAANGGEEAGWQMIRPTAGSALVDVVKYLPGAQFSITERGSDTPLTTVTSDENGQARPDAGITFEADTVYEIRETSAPEGYRQSEGVWTFRATDYRNVRGFDGTIDIWVPNQTETGRIVISKLDSVSGLPLYQDVNFQITRLIPDPAGEHEVDGQTYSASRAFTDRRNANTRAANGSTATINNMSFGTYLIQETSTPDGYQENSQNYYVTITREENDTTAIIYNEPLTVTFNLAKVDYGGPMDGMEGAEFDLSAVDASLENSAWYTAENQVPGQRYRLIETRAPQGAELLIEPMYFTINPRTAGGYSVDIEGVGNEYPAAIIDENGQLVNSESGQPIDASLGQWVSQIGNRDAEDANSVTIALFNMPGVAAELPRTGGVGIWISILLGTLVLLAGAVGDGTTPKRVISTNPCGVTGRGNRRG